MKTKFTLTALSITLSFLLLTLNSSAFTTVPAGNVSGHWTLAGSPYNITGSVIIPTHTTLTVDPGVVVSFQTAYLSITVHGQLLAVGTSADTITFTASSPSAGFRGIRFEHSRLYTGNDTSKFIYCKIQYGKADSTDFTNGNGGGLLFNNWSKAIVSHSLITNCTTIGNGGAILCDSTSSPIITYNTISYNSAAQSGSGGYGGGICCSDSSSPLISHNIISNNYANGYGSGGGIANMFYTSPLITYNTITYNSTGGNGLGGGVFCGGSNTVISHNIISHNVCGGQYCHGGGICCGAGVYTVITYNTITYNSALTADGFGGGIYCGDGGTDGIAGITVSSIRHNLISYNSAIRAGGIFCGAGSPFETGADTRISSIAYDTISNNSAVIDAGGIYCGTYDATNNTSNIDTISNVTITNNTASGGNGGGFYCSGTNTIMMNVTIANNYAIPSGNYGGNGGGLFCDVNAKPKLYNCILWHDTASVTGGGNELYQNDSASAPNFYYSDVRGAQAAFGLGTNIYYGAYTNNINSNPKFVSPSAAAGSIYDGVSADWRLLSGSPCIDTGSPLSPYSSYPSKDLAGSPRIVICRIDEGVYENQYSTSAPLNVYVSGAASICLHTSEALTAHGAASYVWSPSAGLSSTVIANPSASPIVSTTYTVVGTSGICQAKDTIRITVNTVDTSVTVSAGTLTANANAAAYQWINCGAGTAITGAVNQSYTASASGNYAVIVTQNGCSDTSSCYSLITTGISRLNTENAFTIAPNPFSFEASITFNSEQKNTTVKLMDVLGKEIRTIIFSGKQLQLEKGEIKSGIYFVQITDEKKNVVTKKVVIE